MALDLSALDEIHGPVEAPGAIGWAPLHMFEEDPGNPRTEHDADALAVLVKDIRERGILQPIVVRRLSTGRLQIRFGSRRYRAAQEIGLAEAPYVVTQDERQFDDYAQVSENERRQPLQPLELASFVMRKLGEGEKKKEVAARLGLSPSAITYLLSLARNPPSFILDLYHSGKCRSPQYLYELRRMWESQPRLVEERCAAWSEVDRAALADLSEIVGMSSSPTLVPTSTCTSGSGGVISNTVSKGSNVGTSTTPNDAVPKSDRISLRARGKPIQRNEVQAISAPELRATYCGRNVTVELGLKPSVEGRIIVKDTGGILWEVPIHALRLTALDEMVG